MRMFFFPYTVVLSIYDLLTYSEIFLYLQLGFLTKVQLKISLLPMIDGVKEQVESMVVSFLDLIAGNPDIWLITNGKML